MFKLYEKKEAAMKYLGKVKWVDMLPTQEEAGVNLYRVRADQGGVRMEVRILNTVECGVHVAIIVADKNRLLSVKEQILITPGTLHLKALEEGKRRAEIWADTWLGMVLNKKGE